MDMTEVVLVDLRAGERCPFEPAGRILVLDDADALVEHAETYLALTGEEMVTGIVCVVVGESTATGGPHDGAVLDVPAALTYAAILWAGDTRGVEWAPGSEAPRPAAAGTDSLDSLIAALRVPEVFDQVVAAAERTGPATSPGVRVVPVGPSGRELAEARDAVVRGLGVLEPAASPAGVPDLRGVGGERLPERGVLTDPVRAAGTEAARWVRRTSELAVRLGTAQAVFGAQRPTARLGEHFARASAAAENYRLYLTEVLNRVDGHLETGHPLVDDVLELGVPAPVEANGRAVVTALRDHVDRRIGAGASLPGLALELRMAAAAAAPQGCAATLDKVRNHPVLALAMPPFSRWPLSLAAIPWIFVSCLALTVLLGPGPTGWVAGGLLAAGWFGAGWLLLSRSPVPTGERGFPATALPALLGYAIAAVAGVGARLAGEVAALSTLVPRLVAQSVSLVVVVLSACVVVLSWRSAVRRWQAAVPAAALLETMSGLTGLTEEAVGREWVPMRRHSAIATAATEVAVSLEEVAQELERSRERLFAVVSDDSGGEARHSVPPELYDVVRGDLADLAVAALEPVWPATESGRDVTPGVLSKGLDRLLHRYDTHVRQRGLLAAPEFGRDRRPRDALTARVWAESAESPAVLRTGADAVLMQLCRSAQLRFLRTVNDPELIRFAPAQLRRVLEEQGNARPVTTDPRIIWSESGEVVGALRLLPLRPESVRKSWGGVS
ncbi:hypothetical protein Amsp01_104300 [Amycolatopsis sp. NBRC 101858]|uniref:hypothetical protein n=1 Tax=Amycolatopsis sp. NBRC 101858 TaxID=3032200 RepID=UPI0024A49384|nr:hypothetical protein [Amycolatopsis sp. NBRC 101858]GLY44407.1 hypothetical protein Amsp01_104300 [Amycolatopsis sp. NBRC 101858]